MNSAASSKDKNLHIVEGGTHVGMYDMLNLVGEAMPKLGPPFQNCLNRGVHTTPLGHDCGK